jgi:hypothetical protein
MAGPIRPRLLVIALTVAMQVHRTHVNEQACPGAQMVVGVNSARKASTAQMVSNALVAHQVHSLCAVQTVQYCGQVAPNGMVSCPKPAQRAQTIRSMTCAPSEGATVQAGIYQMEFLRIGRTREWMQRKLAVCVAGVGPRSGRVCVSDVPQ